MKTQIEIIPLTQNKTLLNDLNEIDFDNECYVTGITSITKLLMIDEYPVKKTLAIKKILSFLKSCNMYNHYDNKNNILSIKSKVLIKYFGISYYNAFMNVLKDNNILSKIPHKDGSWYKKNEYCMQYRLFNEYLNDEPCLVMFNNKKYGKINIEGKFNKKLIETIKNIDINYVNAINDEILNYTEHNNLNSLKHNMQNLMNLNGDRFIKYGDKSERVYHSLSNLSSTSRKHLHIDNKTFNDIDVKNCQPLLLCAYLDKNEIEYDENYKTDCENSVLYERFIQDGLNDIEYKKKRKEVKVELYSCIFFDLKKYKSMYFKFKELYPKTTIAIENLHKDEQETLASKLQNLEASIFNNLIPVKSEYYFTLFDGIYFTDLDDYKFIIDYLTNAFKQYNITPKFKLNDNDLDDNIIQLYNSFDKDEPSEIQNVSEKTEIAETSEVIENIDETNIDEIDKIRYKIVYNKSISIKELNELKKFLKQYFNEIDKDQKLLEELNELINEVKEDKKIQTKTKLEYFLFNKLKRETTIC